MTKALGPDPSSVQRAEIRPEMNIAVSEEGRKVAGQTVGATVGPRQYIIVMQRHFRLIDMVVRGLFGNLHVVDV